MKKSKRIARFAPRALLAVVAAGFFSPGAPSEAAVLGDGDSQGPIVTDIVLSPNPNFGSSEIKIVAVVDDTETGGSPIAGAEYSVGDRPKPSGEGVPLDGDFGAYPRVVVRGGYIFTAGAGGRERGQILFYVRGKDAAGNWGDPFAAILHTRPYEFLPAEYVYFYPNPCRGNVGSFRFTVAEGSEVTIRVYDLRGRLVDTVTELAPAYASENVAWDLSGVAPDVYVFSIHARSLTTGAESIVTKKFVIIR